MGGQAKVTPDIDLDSMNYKSSLIFGAAYIYLPLLRRDTSSSRISSPNKSSTLLRWKTKKMLLLGKEELNRPKHEILQLVLIAYEQKFP